MAPTLTIAEQLISDVFTSPSQQANNVGAFTVTLTSSAWEVVAGILVTVSLEESRDNGQTWTLLLGFTAVTGPLGAPPHNVMPSATLTYPNVRGSRRLRLKLSVSAPLLVGADVTAA